ncbi:YceI family protein [Cohnella terricola]|uniref:Polyisoprenoid-binding protein n=1 Tax=Cohnella terricola TaxID=1289167 RepID=A0A559JLA0_9BACL|nr:YceI family protein [Cohnella terricola]TVY00644.1 polyisoprenoid-binding protein [Cohnella terricola]
MAASNWNLDKSHSGITFSVRHMMITNVRGSFNDFNASVSADPASLSDLDATVTIEVGSIDTKDEGRDGHLKSPDFFNAEQFPQITFKKTALVSKGGEDYSLTGDLTIAGVTKSVTLNTEISGPAKDPWGNTKFGVVADGAINRSDFGLTWNAALETGGFLVGDAIKIHIELEFAQG